MRILLLIVLMIFFGDAYTQQISDTAYQPEILKPAYASGSGPLVLIDAGHHNSHTKDERYWALP